MKTVVLDLEVADAVSNTNTGFFSWQMDILNGVKAGQLNVISAGRQSGKSWFTNNLCKEIFLPMSPAEKKYRFSRAKWYTAQLNRDALWLLSKEYNTMIEWCTEQFGAHPAKPDAWSRWWFGIGEINFRDEKDLMMYQLRWA